MIFPDEPVERADEVLESEGKQEKCPPCDHEHEINANEGHIPACQWNCKLHSVRGVITESDDSGNNSVLGPFGHECQFP